MSEQVLEQETLEKNQSEQPQKRLFVKTEVLDTEKHKNLRWRCLGASCPQSCCYVPVRSSVGMQEMEYLSMYFPISFPLIKNEQTGEQHFEMNLFFKLDIDKTGHCVYLKEPEGCQLGDDKPYACKQYPFSPTNDVSTGRTIITIDLTCPGWSENEGDIVLLSKTEMNPTFMNGFVKPGINFLNEYQQTRIFVNTLVNYNLIKPATYNYRGVTVGLNAVDEKALLELPKEVLKDFEARGYIKAIYYHLHSLQNYRKLIDAYLSRNPQQIVQMPTAFAL